MTAVIHRVRRDDDRQWRYIAAGAAGAIEYHALRWNGDPLGIEHHSPRPLHDGDEPDRCDILEGSCYPDGTSLGARDLHRKWLDAGCDDEVIWAELETRYAEMAREAGR
jgi:hypothetical protein